MMLDDQMISNSVYSSNSDGDLLRRGLIIFASADIGRCRPISLAGLETDVKSPYLIGCRMFEEIIHVATASTD